MKFVKKSGKMSALFTLILGQHVFLQGFNVILGQNSMLTVWNFGFFLNSVSGPVMLGPVVPIAQTGPSTTGPETEFLKKAKILAL